MRAKVVGLLMLAAGAGCVGPGKWLLPENLPVVSSDPAADSPRPADELAPDDAGRLALTMAEALDKDGKQTDAILYYERARDQNPKLTDKAARRLAVLYDQQDQQAKAMAEFRELLKAHPKDAGLLNDVGYSYYNRGDWVQAEQHLRKAVGSDKTLKRAWVNLGMALAQQGRYAEAEDAFGKAVTPAEVHANLGFVLAIQGKRDEAKEAYRKALELEPTLKVAHAALAKLDAPPTQ